MNRIITILAIVVSSVACAFADDEVYSVQLKMDVTDAEGTTSENQTSFTGSAPITAYVSASVVNSAGEEQSGVTCTGQWRVWLTGGDISSPYIERTDNPTQFTFTDGGVFRIAYVGKILCDKLPGGYVEYTEEDAKNIAFSVSAASSVLTFPNAFSPNGDGYNDVFKAKEVKSIVEFHGSIFNRWGQRLYQWDNAQEGWDGTYNGRPVKDGVYYVLVKAKGADGIEYEIKKDVNLMRGYTQESTTE